METLTLLSSPILVPHYLCGFRIVRGIYLPLICITIFCIKPFLIVMVPQTYMLRIQMVSNAWYLFEHTRYLISVEVISLWICKVLVIHLWPRSISLNRMVIG